MLKIESNIPRWLQPYVILLVATYAFAAQEDRLKWERLEDMPVGVFDAAMSRRGNWVVITGGITQTGDASDQVQIFDLDTLTWKMGPPLEKGVCLHTQVTLRDGRIFVAGGMVGRVPGKLKLAERGYIVDIDAGTVESFALPTHLLEAPTSHLLPDGRVIFVSGSAASVFNPVEKKWEQTIDLWEQRKSHASMLLKDGRVLVAGGLGRNSIELVDTQNGASKMLAARLPLPLDDLRMLELSGGQVWVLGGQSILDGNTTDRTWVIDLSDPQVSKIVEGPSLGIPTGVADHCVSMLGSWVVIVGGESQQNRKDTELREARLLHTETGLVWALPKTRQPHDDAVAVTTDREVIVFGGYQVKSMTLPSLKIDSESGQKELGLPGIGLPVASVMVERIRVPIEAEPMVMIDGRSFEAQAVFGSFPNSGLSTAASR